MRKARDPNQLRRLLDDRDLTHRELAKLVGCSHAHVRFVLDGRACNTDLAKRFARTLRRPVDELFVDATPSAEQSTGHHGAVA